MIALSADGATASLTREGIWDGCGEAPQISYQWVRTAHGFPITDQTDFSYTVSPSDDQGLSLVLYETATNSYGSRTVASNAVHVPSNDGCTPASVAVLSQPPTLEGEAAETNTISVSDGSWTSCGSAIAGYTFQWLRDGFPISNATDQSYTLTSADTGHSVSAQVTAWNGSGTSSVATSDAQTVASAPAADPPPVLAPLSGSASANCFGPLDDSTACGASAHNNNFGGLRWDRPTQLDVRGVRSAIQAPSANSFWLPYLTAGVMRVSAESGHHLIQAGFGRTYRLPIGTCGDSPNEGTLYSYFEWMYGSSNVEQCEWLNPVAPGSSHLFTVYRKLAANVVPASTKVWQVNIDSEPINSQYIGDDGMQVALAGGELINANPDPVAIPDGTVFGCYGCKSTPVGLWHWQWTPVEGASGWRDVTSANVLDSSNTGNRNDGRWTVTGFPGPFVVHHVCKSDHTLGC